jgi:hypothetical protein
MPSRRPACRHRHISDRRTRRKEIGTKGETRYIINAEHRGYTVCIAPDGTITSKAGGMTYHGRWLIKSDGHFCSKFSSFNNGEETCTLSHRDGSEIYSVLDSFLAAVGHKQVPGNRERL